MSNELKLTNYEQEFLNGLNISDEIKQKLIDEKLRKKAANKEKRKKNQEEKERLIEKYGVQEYKRRMEEKKYNEWKESTIKNIDEWRANYITNKRAKFDRLLGADNVPAEIIDEITMQAHQKYKFDEDYVPFYLQSEEDPWWWRRKKK